MLLRARVRAHVDKARHKGYPFKVFGGLRDASLLHEVDNDCEGTLDTWSLRTKKHFGALTITDARMFVRSTAIHARDQTVPIEHGHGTMRRHIVTKSEQSSGLSLMSLKHHWPSKKFSEIDDKVARAQ